MTTNKPLTAEQLYLELESIFNDMPGARFSERVELRKEARLLIDSIYDRADAEKQRADRLAEALKETIELVKKEVPIGKCDHEVGLCWCDWKRVIERIDKALTQEPAERKCETCGGDCLPERCRGWRTGKAPEREPA